MRSGGNRKDGLIKIDETLIKQWDLVCENSDFPNPFMKNSFLEISFPTASRYFWFENSIIRAALVVPILNSSVQIPGFSVFHSICLISKKTESLRNWGIVEKNNFLQNTMRELVTVHKDFDLSFSPDFQDIRPLLWHNFNTSSDNFSISPRYSAIKDLRSLSSECDLIETLNVNRRRIFRKIEKAGLRLKENINVDDFMMLYQETFSRQNISPNLQTLEKVRALLNQIARDNGLLLGAIARDGTLLSGLAVLKSQNRAYSLFIVNSAEGRESGASTWLVVKALLLAKSIGIDFFDFVGANTQGRGNFKLSFGADLQLYFEAKYRSTPGF